MLQFAAPFLGGLTIGVLSVGRLLVRGQILGVSGYVRNLVKGKSVDRSKALHVAGMLAGGFLLSKYAPSSLETVPATYSLLRAGVAGLLVGAGAALGGGCTSGHGVCGLARASPRSAVFMGLIILSGAVSARLSSTTAAINPVVVRPSQDGDAAVRSGLGLLAAAVATLAVSAYVAKEEVSLSRAEDAKPPAKSGWTPLKVLGRIIDLAEGVLFSFALGMAGMTKPSKVVGFLTLEDLSAAFVMGGAVLVSLPVFLPIFSKRESARGKAASGNPYPTPPTKIDGRLILGGVLFGLGWGAGGYCPGPALASVSLEAPKQALVFLATMLGAFFAL